MDDNDSDDPGEDQLPEVLPTIKLLGPIEGSQIGKAYAMLEKIILTSKRSSALVLWSEVNRKGPTNGELGLGALALCGITWLTHWWIALPVSACVAFWRVGRRAFKMRKKAQELPRSHPDIEEFENLWALNSWKIVPLVYGFNVRAKATNQLIRDGKKLDSARKMSDLLACYRDQLAAAWRLLHELRPHKEATQPMFIDLKVIPHVNDRLSIRDPLGIGAGATDLDWLALEKATIHPDRFDEVLERDMAVAIDAQAEINDASTEAIFARLKRQLDE